MSFTDRIQSLTGLTLGTTAYAPTTGAALTLVKEGIKDVTLKSIKVDPSSAHLFSKTITQGATNYPLSVESGIVVQVLLEDNGANKFRVCEKVDAELEWEVTNSSSIHYATYFTPVYWQRSKSIYIYPTPTDDTGKKSQITYVDFSSKGDTNGTTWEALDLAHNAIENFPDAKFELVCLYASVKTLEHSLASFSENQLASDIDPGSPPVMPILEETSISWSKAPPSYISPSQVATLPSEISFAGMTHSLPVNFPVAPAAPDVSANTVGSLPTAPVYTPAVMSPDFEQVKTFIDDEDAELTQLQLSKISSEISDYSTRNQSALNEFNDANTEYQADIQKLFEDARMEDSADGRKLQKYSNELNAYSTEMSKFQDQIARYQAEMNQVIQESSSKLQRWQSDLSRYQAELQNSINQFNQENTDYQADLQVAIQNAQLTSSQDATRLQKFSSELSSYQADVQTKVQEFSTKLQKDTTQYQWMQGQMALLKQEYNEGFVPSQQPLGV